MFCGYPAYRRPACIALRTPCRGWLGVSCFCNACGGHKYHSQPPKSPEYLLPITGSSDCPTQLTPSVESSPFSPFSPYTPVNEDNGEMIDPIIEDNGEMISPITPLSAALVSSEVMSPITPFNSRRPAMRQQQQRRQEQRSKVFVGIMPGCGACKQLQERLREDGIKPRTLDTTTREGRAEFERQMGFKWMHQTYPQMYVQTPQGWYHIGGNSDYANMRESLRDCRLSSDPDVDCLIRSGAQLASP